jgi:penicillin V acylase-like amidase (Ntn superfamily)
MIGKDPMVLHLALEDKAGDSVIIEYVEGKIHGPHIGDSYPVATNVLTCDRISELEYEKHLDQEPTLSGRPDTYSRFFQAHFLLKHLPKPQDETEAVAYLMSVLRNVSQPFGIPDEHIRRDAVRPTWWRSLAYLTDDYYYFETTISPFLIWMNLKELDLANQTVAKKLDIANNPRIFGEVSNAFEPADPFAWPEAMA